LNIYSSKKKKIKCQATVNRKSKISLRARKCVFH